MDRTSLDILGRNTRIFPYIYVVAEETIPEAAIGKRIVGRGRQLDKQMEGNNSFCWSYPLLTFLVL